MSCFFIVKFVIQSFMGPENLKTFHLYQDRVKTLLRLEFPQAFSLSILSPISDVIILSFYRRSSFKKMFLQIEENEKVTF